MEPAISVIIPAYNESATIPDLLEIVSREGAEEVIVVDGGSEDGTSEIARRYCRVIKSALGRAQQMNVGAHAATGDILLFLHADVRLAPGTLNAVRYAMQDPAVAGGNLDIRYDGSGWAPVAFTCINRWRRRYGIFYGDSGIFCRRALFQKLGGYPPWPILEDYHFARRLWKCGRLALLDEPLSVSDRRWKTSGLFRTLCSWVLIQGLYYCGVPPRRLARLYRHVR
jgi:rSAM/selenodomain-associated transferase 2